MDYGNLFGIVVLGLGALVFLVWIYFLPTLHAVKAMHPDQKAIFVLNLLLGWAVVPWVIALVWAYKSFPVSAQIDEQLKQEARDHKKCPFCAERILVEAIKCRYCGSALPSHEIETQPA